MIKTTQLFAAVALLVMLIQPTYAHVAYFDLSANLFVNDAGQSWDEETFTNYGWYNGTQPTLGDSHELAGGVFFKFHLAQESYVNIGFGDASDSTSLGYLNPAFSLYSGLLPDQAHDDTLLDPLNPSHLVLTPAPAHTVKDPSFVDNGVAMGANGNVSPFRDTANITYHGQFNALGDWSMANANANVFCTSKPGGVCNATSLSEANAAGDWSVIKYITHVDPTGGTQVSLNNYLLGPGDYTIAAGGGTAGGTIGNTLLGTVTFSSSAYVAAVPLPSAIWLFMSGMMGFLGMRFKIQRKSLMV